jgi:hypothetical protein
MVDTPELACKIYCHVSWVPWRLITSSGLDDWINWPFFVEPLLIACHTADLHTFEFTALHAVSISRILATDLNTWTFTSNHYEVFLSFPLPTKHSTGTPLPILQCHLLKLLYDGRFTANQFVLATGLLGPTTSNFIFQMITSDYSPYVTSSLTRE